MKWGRLFVLSCVVALGISTALAQELTVLQLELTRGDSVVARPQLILSQGRVGRLDLNGEWATANPLIKGLREKIEITPAVRDNDISLAFQIASGDRRFRPSLVMSSDVRGSVEWTAADGQPLRLTVSWVR